NGGTRLVTGGEKIRAEFTALRDAGGVVAPYIDTVVAAVLSVARPAHRKVAGAVHRDARLALGVRYVGIDVKLRGQCRTGGIEATRVDANAVVTALVAGPTHDEVAICIDGNRGCQLAAIRGAIDAERRTLRHRCRIEALRENAIAAAINTL